jgi:hypothetical protein
LRSSNDIHEVFYMKRLAALAIAVTATSAPLAGTTVGVSIGINQPGIYGRVDIGNVAPPPVIYAQPVVVAPAPVAVYQAPIYLYVPVAYQQNWPQYCARYAACGQPVYFVQEQWVQERYRAEQERRERHWNDDDNDQGRGRYRGRGKHHDD